MSVIDINELIDDEYDDLENKKKKKQELINLFSFDLITDDEKSNVFDIYKTSFKNKIDFSYYFKIRIDVIIYEIDYIIKKYCNVNTQKSFSKKLNLIKQISSLLIRTNKHYLEGDIDLILCFLFLREKIKKYFKNRIDLLLINNEIDKLCLKRPTKKELLIQEKTIPYLDILKIKDIEKIDNKNHILSSKILKYYSDNHLSMNTVLDKILIDYEIKNITKNKLMGMIARKQIIINRIENYLKNVDRSLFGE